jgi:hypothetical protein
MSQDQAIAQRGQEGMSENVRKCPKELNLNAKQLAAIDMLARGKSCGDVARELSIDPRTLYRWRQEDDFAQWLHERRMEMWAQAIERMQGLVHPSLDVIAHFLQPGKNQFRAACAILRMSNVCKMIGKP